MWAHMERQSERKGLNTVSADLKSVLKKQDTVTITVMSFKPLNALYSLFILFIFIYCI